MKLIDEVWEWVKKRVSDSVLMLCALVLFGGIVSLRGREVVAAVVREEVAPTQRQVDEHERKLGHQADDFHELGKDVRALYQTVLTRSRQERLERPFPSVDVDGGAP